MCDHFFIMLIVLFAFLGESAHYFIRDGVSDGLLLKHDLIKHLDLHLPVFSLPKLDLFDLVLIVVDLIV